MPLRNRLEEVIRRYEKASTLVKKYKEGEVSEEELGHGFHGLREERRLVDENNRMYLQEQRRVHLGEKVAREYEEGLSEDDEQEEEDEEESDLDEEDEEEEEEDADEGDNTDQVDVTEAPSASVDKREAKLWKQYGEFWDSA
jgi:hypothetical protein